MSILINRLPFRHKGYAAQDKVIRGLLSGKDIQYAASHFIPAEAEAMVVIGGNRFCTAAVPESSAMKRPFQHGLKVVGCSLSVHPNFGRYKGLSKGLYPFLKNCARLSVSTKGCQEFLKAYGIEAEVIPDLLLLAEEEPVDFTVPPDTVVIAAYHPVQDMQKHLQPVVWKLKSAGFNLIQLPMTPAVVPLDGVPLLSPKYTYGQFLTILRQCKGLLTTGHSAAAAGYKAGIAVLCLPVNQQGYWLGEDIAPQTVLPFSTLTAPEYPVSHLQKLIEGCPEYSMPDLAAISAFVEDSIA